MIGEAADRMCRIAATHLPIGSARLLFLWKHGNVLAIIFGSSPLPFPTEIRHAALIVRPEMTPSGVRISGRCVGLINAELIFASWNNQQ